MHKSALHVFSLPSPTFHDVLKLCIVWTIKWQVSQLIDMLQQDNQLTAGSSCAVNTKPATCSACYTKFNFDPVRTVQHICVRHMTYYMCKTHINHINDKNNDKNKDNILCCGKCISPSSTSLYCTRCIVLIYFRLSLTSSGLHFLDAQLETSLCSNCRRPCKPFAQT